MKYKSALRGVLAMLLLILVSSFTFEAPTMRYTPVGSWEYSVPGFQAGYESGTMNIAEDGKGYKVTMQLNEYFRVDAESVIYKKKDISFTIYVETEEILVSGTFDGDEFAGSISNSEGEFNLTAVRKLVE